MYDVIIIGARVAGAATAFLLAKKGLQVLLVDKTPFPADTVSTHLLQPRALAYLYHWSLIHQLKDSTPILNSFCYTREDVSFSSAPSQLDLKNALNQDHGWSTSHDGSSIPVEWMIIRRKLLDPLIVNAAIEAGAEFRDDFPVDSIYFENNKAGGIIFINSQGQKEVIKSKFVVMANGRLSRLMHNAGSAITYNHPKQEFCFYNYFSGIDSTGLKIPVHIRGKYGLAYGPTNEDNHILSVWGPSAFGRQVYQQIEKNFYSIVRFCYPELADRLFEGKAEEQFKGMIAVSNTDRQATGTNWLAVGDAASCLSQSTAIGITNAFRDAEFAAHYLGEAFAGHMSIEAATQAYSVKHYKDLDDYFKFVCEASECNLATQEQIALLQALSHNPEQAGHLLAVIGRILPVSSFFNPDNIEQIMLNANADEIRSLAFIQNFSTLQSHYEQQQPWQ